MHTSWKSSTPKPMERRRTGAAVLCLAAGTVLLFLLSLSLGASGLSLGEAAAWLLGREVSAQTAQIMAYIRLPRSLACLLCGGALAVAGLLLQSALGNSLASPSTIGVNAGAGLFAVAAAWLFPYSQGARTAGVLLGALCAAFFVYAVAHRAQGSRLTIVLAGVAISTLMSAGIDAIVTIRPEALTDRAAFTIGGFASVSTDALLMALPYMAAGLAGAFLLAPRLNLLLLGDETAASLGVAVRACRFLSIFGAAALAAGAVSVCGLLGFVGLMVPHMLRRVTLDIRGLVPLCALGGSALVLLCDILARVLFVPYELPVGILLSGLGGPFFLFLILRRKKGGNP